MGINMAIGMAIDLITTSIVEFIQKSERIHESAKGIVNEYQNIQSTFTQNSSTLSNLQGRYDELSKGVDNFGNNLSLTSGEYEEYKAIMSQVSSIMPELNMRYDSQGNAVGVLTGKIKDLNVEYEKYKQKQIQELFTQKDNNGNNIYDVMENFSLKNEDNAISRELGFITKDIYDEIDSFTSGDIVGALKQHISNSIFNGGGIGSFGGLFHIFRGISDEMSGTLDEQVKKLEGEIESGDYQGEELGEKTAKLLELKQQLNSETDVFRTYANGYAQIYDANKDGITELSTLTNEQQAFVSTLFTNMTPEFLKQNGLQSEGAIINFVQGIITALGKEEGKVSDAFNRLLKFDISQDGMNPEEAKTALDKIIQDLLTALKESGIEGIDDSAEGVKQFKISYGLECVDAKASPISLPINTEIRPRLYHKP